MKTRTYSARPLAALAALALGSTSANATIVEINGIGGSNNDPLPSAFASNLSSDIGGATVSNGATPDIALAWALSGSGWERHGSNVWNALDPATGTPDIAQMDYTGSGTDEPTVTFTVGATVALQLNSLDIGHATDQNEPDFAWTITLSEVGGSQVFSHTTAAMGPGDTEAVVFNFTGGLGVDYILELDGADRTNRGALDNLSFNQVIPGPDLTPPTIVTLDPADDSTGVPLSTNMVATFDEDIAVIPGGLIYLTNLDAPSVTTIAATDASQVSVSGAVLTIDPTSDLAGSTEYAVTFGANTISDVATTANVFADTAFDIDSWTFTTTAVDVTAPAITTLAPFNGETDVAPGTNLVATFDEDVQEGSGNILIRELVGGAIVSTIAVTSSEVTVSGATVTIDPSSDLSFDTGYYVEIANGAIEDLSGNPFGGIAGNGTWSFTTASPPVPGTIVHINGIGLGNNTDLPATFASNLSSDIGGATVSSGGTPGIALAWALSGNGWEVHSSGVWDALDPSTGTADILQMDRHGSSDNPTVTFTVGAGVALHLNSLDIGHASDQNEPAFAWTITISEVGGAQVFSHTTAAMVGGDTEAVTFNFTGNAGVDYILEFDDGGAATNRGAIDNLSFAQVTGSSSAYDTWATSNGVPTGSEGTDSDTGGFNNLGEFGLGGNPTNGNDDGSLLHVFSANLAGDSAEEGILTILVRNGASGTFSTADPSVSAAADGIVYTVGADTTPDVGGGGLTVTPTAAVTTGLPPAPAGYTYESFYISGAKGFFQVTVALAP